MLACIVDAKMILGAPACTFSAEKRESHSYKRRTAFPLTFLLYVLCVVAGLAAVSVPKTQLKATDPFSDCMSFA